MYIDNSAIPIHRTGPAKGKRLDTPDHPPPAAYVCYRCGEKGHWIQVCPTNNDPAYDGRQRVKRTTGIPRSFLKTVQKPTTLVNDGTVDDTKQPSAVMVNAEGEWVIAEPDKASWDQYQAKAKVSAAAQEAAARGNKELQDKGLECPIDKRPFVEPTRTPCCLTTFCRDCIINALLENDLRCPECSTDNILLDDLKADEEMVAKIHNFEERAADQVRKEDSKSPIKREPLPPQTETNAAPGTPSAKTPSPQKAQSSNGSSRKRPAETEIKNERTAPGPNGGDVKPTNIHGTKSDSQGNKAALASNMPTNQSFSFLNGNYMMPQVSNVMAFSNMNNYMGIPMSMDPAITMNMAIQNPMMMPNGSFMGNDWNNIWGTGYPQQPMNMTGAGFQNGMMPNGMYSQQNMLNNPVANGFLNTGGGRMNEMGMNGQGVGSFANQQRTSFSAPSTNEEDSAYFRKPVNPHRHQARRNINRPTDYHEI